MRLQKKAALSTLGREAMRQGRPTQVEWPLLPAAPGQGTPHKALAKAPVPLQSLVLGVPFDAT